MIKLILLCFQSILKKYGNILNESNYLLNLNINRSRKTKISLNAVKFRLG